MHSGVEYNTCMAQKDYKPEDTEDLIDRKLGMLIEHMNSQFERVLESVESATKPVGQIGPMNEKLQTISDRLEVIEYDSKLTRLSVDSIKHDTKMLKLRSDRNEDTQRQQAARIDKLESKP